MLNRYCSKDTFHLFLLAYVNSSHLDRVTINSMKFTLNESDFKELIFKISLEFYYKIGLFSLLQPKHSSKRNRHGVDLNLFVLSFTNQPLHIYPFLLFFLTFLI